jgi:hypothetical protein
MTMKHPRLASLDSLKGAAPAARQSRFRGALGSTPARMRSHS